MFDEYGNNLLYASDELLQFYHSSKSIDEIHQMVIQVQQKARDAAELLAAKEAEKKAKKKQAALDSAQQESNKRTADKEAQKAKPLNQELVEELEDIGDNDEPEEEEEQIRIAPKKKQSKTKAPRANTKRKSTRVETGETDEEIDTEAAQNDSRGGKNSGSEKPRKKLRKAPSKRGRKK